LKGSLVARWVASSTARKLARLHFVMIEQVVCQMNALRSGAVLPIWKVLSDTVIPDQEKKARPSDMDSAKSKDHARVVRLKLDSGEPIIGLSLVSEDVFKVKHPAVFFRQLECYLAVHAPLVVSMSHA